VLLSLVLLLAAHWLAIHMKKSGGLPVQQPSAMQMTALSNPVPTVKTVQI